MIYYILLGRILQLQRERAQEDFKVLFEGAPPHPPPHSHMKDSHSTGITLLFSNSACVLLRPKEISTFWKELLWDGTSGLSSLSEKTRKSNHLQMQLQRQHFLLSYLNNLSVGPVGVSNSQPPVLQPGAQPSEQLVCFDLQCGLSSVELQCGLSSVAQLSQIKLILRFLCALHFS